MCSVPVVTVPMGSLPVVVRASGSAHLGKWFGAFWYGDILLHEYGSAFINSVAEGCLSCFPD